MSESRDGDIMVTVCIFAYNHEYFIEEAVRSVINQICSFAVEILIGEDGSTDKTKFVLDKLEAEFPNKLSVIYQDQTKKIYINGRPSGRYNFLNLLRRAKGKFIALLDGDDYWTDPLKLQKQVDFLEGNEDFSGCAHRRKSVFMQDRIVRKKQMHENLENKIVSEEDLFSIYPFQTATFVFRKSAISNKFKWLNILKGGDINLYIVVASSGKIMKLGEEMSVYRIHEGGVTARYKFNDINLKVQKTKGFIKLSALFPKNNRKKISRVISHQAIQHIDTAVSLNQKENALKLLILFMRVTPINKIKIRWLIGSFKKCIISR